MVSTRGVAAGDAAAGGEGAGDDADVAGDGARLAGWVNCGRLATGGSGMTANGVAEGDAFGINVPGAK